MYKCIKIMWHISSHAVESILLHSIQQSADGLSVEGILCAKSPDLLEIMVAGEKQAVDKFLDEMYCLVESSKKSGDLEIIAAAKERDYRGVFRIII